MIQSIAWQSGLQRIGTAVGIATALANGAAWILLVVLSGELIPRGTLVAATLVLTVAACAWHASRERQAQVLLIAATFSAIAPPAIGAAPEFFQYLGFLAVGYVIAAALFVAASGFPRRFD